MADTNSSTKTPTAGAAGPAGPSLSQRVAGFFRAGGATGQRRQTSSTTRFIIGSVTFVLVAELLTYLIDFANIQYKLNLNQPIIGPNASWFTWFFVINVVLILGLWILLNRLGFFPRDMWAPRNGTTRGATSSGKNGSTASKSVSEIPGIGKQRTRAERRRIAEAQAAQAAQAAKGKGDKGDKGRAAATTRTTATEAAISAEHDEAYERVRAAQRTRKRRALR